MKCNPWRWAWGLVPLLGLGGLMHMGGTFGSIEVDLKRQAEAALVAGGHDWATVAFSGRDGALIGEAVDNSDQLRAAGIARSVWGVRSFEDQSRLLDEEKNYVWGAQIQSDGRVRLSGFVPTPATRQAVAGAAKATFPSRGIDDRMKMARGAPAQALWEGGISFGLKQLAGLKPGGRVDLEAANLLIEGEAADLATYKSVKSALQSALPQGIRLRSDKVTPPVVKPYTWAAKVAASQVQLNGYVPSERARDEIFAAAKKSFPKFAVVDRLQIAAGEPKDWLQAVLAALPKLGKLDDGSIDARDAQLTLAGLAVDTATADDVRRGMKADLPGAFKWQDAIQVKEVQIKTVDPFTTELNAANGVATLTGYVPSPAGKSVVLEMVKARLPGHKIDDRLEIGNGAAEGWQSCMQAGLLGIGRLGAGRVQVSGRTLMVTGSTESEPLSFGLATEVQNAAGQACASDVRVAFTGVTAAELKRRADAAEAAEAAAKAAAASPPPVVPAAAPVAPPAPTQAKVEAASCQTMLTQVKNEGVINFKRASAELDRTSNVTLNRIVEVMSSCKSARIEVQGHTDAEGTPERNINLSNRRARSVLNYLTAAGVDAARLSAVGYGETQPIAANDTSENRARNRRIEFAVKAE